MSDSQFGFLVSLPGVLVVLAIVLFPIGYLMYISLWQNIILGVLTFSGLQNYAGAIHDPQFWEYLGHTGIYTGGVVSLTFVIGLIIALSLNNIRRRSGVIRTAIILPWAIPPVVAALNWRILLRTQGVVNGILMSLKLIHVPVQWLSVESLAMFCVIMCDVWVNVPFTIVLLLAGLKVIPTQLYDAASMDGAGRLKAFSYITLPLLRPAISIVLIIRTMFAFRNFAIIWGITEGGPGDSTQVLSIWVYKMSFERFRLGYGAAVSVMMLLITMGFVAVYLKFLRFAPQKM